jgi:DNA polymerase III alpha subunit
VTINTIGELLKLKVEGKTYSFDHTIAGTISKYERKDAKNGKKYMNLKIEDNTGKIKLQVWEDNDNYSVIKGIDEDEREGTRIRVENCYVKEGYKGYNQNAPNEIALQWKGDNLGKIVVIGKGTVSEESPDALDNLIDKASGNGAQQKTLKTTKTVKKIADNSSVITVPGFPIEKMDDVIEAVNNIPLAIGNLDKNLQRKMDENNTKLLQQFKEFMSKFIESSNVTEADINDEPPPEE